MKRSSKKNKVRFDWLTLTFVVLAFLLLFFTLYRIFSSRSNIPNAQKIKGWKKLIDRSSATANSKATIQVVEFYSFGCGFCNILHHNLQKLRKKYRSPVVAVYSYHGGLKRLIGRTLPAIYDIKTRQHYPIISLNGTELYYADASYFLIFKAPLDDPNDIQYFGAQPKHFSFVDEPVKRHEDIREKARQYLHQSITNSLQRTKKFIYFNYTNSIPAYYKTWDFTKRKSYLVIYDRETHSMLSEIKLPAYLALILKDGSLLLIESSDPDNFTLGHYEIQMHK